MRSLCLSSCFGRCMQVWNDLSYMHANMGGGGLTCRTVTVHVKLDGLGAAGQASISVPFGMEGVCRNGAQPVRPAWPGGGGAC